MRAPRSRSTREFACVAGWRYMFTFIAGASTSGARVASAHGREQVVGDAVRELRQRVRGRGRTTSELGPVRELDVRDLALLGGGEELRAHRRAGQRLQRERRDEARRRGRRDAAHLVARAPQRAHQLRDLVGGDAAGDRDQDAPLLQAVAPGPGPARRERADAPRSPNTPMASELRWRGRARLPVSRRESLAQLIATSSGTNSETSRPKRASSRRRDELT